ncbi:hypothetical protein EMIT07CA2_210066 [Brevibacillus sp. IT-7CA2]
MRSLLKYYYHDAMDLPIIRQVTASLLINPLHFTPPRKVIHTHSY